MSVIVDLADKDLDYFELGGVVTWIPAGDVGFVTRYVAYLATDEFGANLSHTFTLCKWTRNGRSDPQDRIKQIGGSSAATCHNAPVAASGDLTYKC